MLVSLDADPRSSEGMAAGDAVNTAARLQSAAPVKHLEAALAFYRKAGASRYVAEAEALLAAPAA